MERVFRLRRGSGELRTEERSMKEAKNKTNESIIYLPLSRERERQLGIYSQAKTKSQQQQKPRELFLE